jgi:hypothetical protein
MATKKTKKLRKSTKLQKTDAPVIFTGKFSMRPNS